MLLLGEQIAERRPEIDLYLVAQISIEEVAGTMTRRFQRIFHRDDFLELHLSILRGVAARHEMPFFTALRGYSRQPTGVFHALPISRGKSVVNSPWIHQMSDFYGLNMFLAETSATSGGLDSLLDPSGPDQAGAGAGRARVRCRARPSSSPTGPRRPTRSSCSRSSAPATWSSSIGTATSPTTTR